MTTLIDERNEYQKFILAQLEENGYEIRSYKDYDRKFAIDCECLFRFLRETQSETMDVLDKIYGKDLEEVIINLVGSEETKKGGSRLDILKHGIDISGQHLTFFYNKPATSFNPDLSRLYQKNIFSVAEEVWASDSERVDIVIFINGLAVITIELKSNTSGQTVDDAIIQYQTERDPKTRLFRFKAGALVCFAMDLEQVYMTTKLEKEATYFLPFNRGTGEGVDAGAGNPSIPGKYSTSYMWEDILQKDTLSEIITKFIYIELKEKETEKGIKKTETLIFPRYHQLDVIRKLLSDVKLNKTSQNYLLQHSAGSGKTNEIAWLSHRLTSLHDNDDKIIFDNIIVCTDRVVVDRQLQDAVLGLEHKEGLIKAMDEKCTSNDLADALKSNTKIIVTTIQKFQYIIDEVSKLKEKHFAVIIDEAHSSTGGKIMKAISDTLGSGEEVYSDIEDAINAKLDKTGKKENISMFAFTATPKSQTLQLFGKMNKQGQGEAFHIYSMKQAIEEGFILDVLQNYTTYKTYCELNKTIESDPTIPKSKAKRDIARFIALHETNINQRVEIIIEHFRTFVMGELDGQAKAMVVTSQRESAVKYRQAFEDYVTRKGYKGIHALVAFSGKVVIDETEYSESGMNGFSEKKLPDEFDKDEYQVLIVADKYQTGYDQKKLCAMYVLKTLRGVAAVQTLSRLNRICPPYEKKVFVLDFENDYKDIDGAFSTYYTKTCLSNTTTVKSLYDLNAKIDGYYIISPRDVEEFNQILLGKLEKKDKETLLFLLQKVKKNIENNFDEDKQSEIAMNIRHFVRCYDFLQLATSLDDPELHKKYNFLSYLSTYLKGRQSGMRFNLDGKLAAANFIQKKTGEHKGKKHTSNPIVKLAIADRFGLTPAKEEKLSEIIKEINSRTGKSYDTDVAVKSLLQIRDLIMKSEELKKKAKSNTLKDFEFAFFDNIDEALLNGLSQNQDFFSLLLNNDDIKREVLGIFTDEIYKSLRESETEMQKDVFTNQNSPQFAVASEKKEYKK